MVSPRRTTVRRFARAAWMAAGILFIVLSLCTRAASAQSYEFLSRIPNAPAEQLDEPRAALQTADGVTWIADEDEGRLFRFDSTGTALDPVRQVELRRGTVELDEPVDLHATSDGTLYVVDRGAHAVYVVRDDPGASYALGRKGGDLGYFDSIVSVAVDEAGYVYVLDDKSQHVSIFSPEGEYVSWIRGGVTNFDDVRSVGVNGRGEVYVLETEGPDVHVVDRFGTSIHAHMSLNSKPAVSIEEAADMTVLPNGNFLIVDRETGVVTQFTREGDVIGTFGGDGEGNRGAFAEAGALSVVTGTADRVTVLDVDQKQTQTFRLPAEPDSVGYERPVLTVRPTNTSIPRFRDVAYASDSTVYYIPWDDEEKVVAYRESAQDPLFTLQLDEARSLALDENEQALYVLDAGEKRVVAYDRNKGSLIRKFGGNVPRGLDEPIGIATLKDGSVLVTDRETGIIHRWTSQGVYRAGIGPSPQRQLEPLDIAVDSRDRIYVRDEEHNAVIRLHPQGQGLPGSTNRLRLPSEDVTTPSDALRGLRVDPLGQVHLFNRATQRYAVYDWGERAQPRLAYGRGGDDDVPHTFDDVQIIAFDPLRYVAHVMNRDGDVVTSFQIGIRPPAPEERPAFSVSNDTLIVEAPASESPSVTRYGLLKETASEPDTLQPVASRGIPLPFSPDAASEGPFRYAVLYYSPTDVSAPTPFFTNYFGHGSALFAQGEYDAALSAYRTAIDSMDASGAIQTYTSGRFARLGRQLALDFKTEEAFRYLDAALQLSTSSRTSDEEPDEAVTSTLASGYRQVFRTLAREEQYDSLLTSATRVVAALEGDTARQALTSVVDSLSSALRSLPSTTAREQSVAYYKQLIAWSDEDAPDLQLGLAQAQRELYALQKQTGAPSYERAVTLNQAVASAQNAAEMQSADAPAYHDARLLYLTLLAEQGEYETVVQETTETLTARETPLTSDDERDYRTLQAEAYLGQEKYSEALRVYQQLSAAYPSDDELKIQMADVMVKTGAYDDAKMLYQQLLTKTDGDPRLLMKLGKVELERGNVSEASLQLEKALKADPNLIEAYGPLGEAYEAASNYRKAAEQYTVAVKALRERLGEAKGELGRRSDELETNLARYLGSLGRVNEQMGNYEDAMTAYEALTELRPDDGDAWYGLGGAALSAGRVYQAINALNRARSIRPSSDAVAQQLARARAQRNEISANRPPAEVVSVNIDALYPSLYRNYSDPASLPIGEVVLANNTRLPMQNLRVNVYVAALMDEPTTHEVKSLPSFSNKTVNVGAVFTDAILERTQKETFQATIAFTYQHEGASRSTEVSESFTVYGRNAIKWADRRRLAAFVAPQDEEMIDYVKTVDRRFASEPSYGLNGNVVKAAQLYTVLQGSNLTYSVDPQTDFSVVSQDPTRLDFLQFPEETLKRKAGDCDDLVALYLSLLENAGISTGYVDVPGHVMAAFDTGLSPDELSASGLSSEDVIVKLGTVWIPIEATYLEGKPFLSAWQEGLRRYREEKKANTLPEIISLRDAHEVYQPATFSPDASTPSPPDSVVVYETYGEQISKLYADVTETRRAELQERYEANPSNFVVANDLAILYARSDRLEDAARIYRTALNQSVSSPLILNNYGNVLFRQEKYVRALTMYQRSIEQDASDALVYVNLTRTHLNLGNQESARQAFQKAVEKDPSIESAFSALQEQLQ